MFKLLFFTFLLSNSINLSYCNNHSINNQNRDDKNEYSLRQQIFSNYSIKNIPVEKSTDSILLKYGIQIESLEYFNQVSENIKFNTLIIQQWTDNLLKWNNSHIHNLEHITLFSYQVWKPDLELYNAAEKPIIFDIKGGLKLYSNGTIYYNRPTKYSFSCKLDLKKFPFDTQNCQMTFGSWKYSKKTLDLKPFNDGDIMKNISINPSFSHNEWNIIDISVVHEDIEYLCCPGDYYPNSVFTISLKRNPQKYMVVIIMTIFITISDFFVTFISVDQYKRTFILVFIPLTLLWLQIYIASKIPVIAYSTLMEDILLSCFIITILNAFESAVLYVLINISKNKIFPHKKTIYSESIKKLNIIQYFGKKYYELNLKNKFIHNLHKFDHFYRAFMILFFSIYVGILVEQS